MCHLGIRYNIFGSNNLASGQDLSYIVLLIDISRLFVVLLFRFDCMMNNLSHQKKRGIKFCFLCMLIYNQNWAPKNRLDYLLS